MSDQTPATEDLMDLIFEWGQLKRIPRSGWHRAGVDAPENVAAHNQRAAMLAYVLAHMEGHPDPSRVCTMVVFHEIGETRVGDLDLIAKHYATRAEDRAAQDQLSGMGELGQELLELWDACEHQTSPAGRIAKDADLLECAFTAREYVETGHPAAQSWIDDIAQAVVTESAKRLVQALDEHSFTGWWPESGAEEKAEKLR